MGESRTPILKGRKSEGFQDFNPRTSYEPVTYIQDLKENFDKVYRSFSKMLGNFQRMIKSTKKGRNFEGNFKNVSENCKEMSGKF